MQAELMQLAAELHVPSVSAPATELQCGSHRTSGRDASRGSSFPRRSSSCWPPPRSFAWLWRRIHCGGPTRTRPPRLLTGLGSTPVRARPATSGCDSLLMDAAQDQDCRSSTVPVGTANGLDRYEELRRLAPRPHRQVGRGCGCEVSSRGCCAGRVGRGMPPSSQEVAWTRP